MKRIVVLWLTIFLSFSSFSQSGTVLKPNYLSYGLLDGKTIFKFNLLGAVVRNYSFYAERIISKRVDVLLSCNVMPKGGVPYIGQFTDDESAKSIRLGTFSFTPEIRFYLASGYGGGFYIAPYYRYEQFKLYQLNARFTDDNGEKHSVGVSGNLDTNSLGILFGCQWLIGSKKNIVLDWSILGIQGGKSSGNFNGLLDETLSQEDREKLKTDIEDALDISFIKSEVKVNENSSNINIDGPWAFIRTSFSIGYRF